MKTWFSSFVMAVVGVLVAGIAMSKKFGGNGSFSDMLRIELPIVILLAAVIGSFSTIALTVLEKSTSRDMSFLYKILVLLFVNAVLTVFVVYYFMLVISSV